MLQTVCHRLSAAPPLSISSSPPPRSRRRNLTVVVASAKKYIGRQRPLPPTIRAAPHDGLYKKDLLRLIGEDEDEDNDQGKVGLPKPPPHKHAPKSVELPPLGDPNQEADDAPRGSEILIALQKAAERKRALAAAKKGPRRVSTPTAPESVEAAPEEVDARPLEIQEDWERRLEELEDMIHHLQTRGPDLPDPDRK